MFCNCLHYVKNVKDEVRKVEFKIFLNFYKFSIENKFLNEYFTLSNKCK